MELVVECNIKEPRNSRRNQLKDRFIYRVLHMPDKDAKETASTTGFPALAMANPSTKSVGSEGVNTSADSRHSDSCVQQGGASAANGYILVGGPGGGPTALLAIAPPLTTIKAPSPPKRSVKSEPVLQADCASSDESINGAKERRGSDLNSVDWSGGPNSAPFVAGDLIDFPSGTFLVLGSGTVSSTALTSEVFDDEMLDFEEHISSRHPIRRRSEEDSSRIPHPTFSADTVRRSLDPLNSTPSVSSGVKQVATDPTRGPAGTLSRQLMLAASEGKLLESWKLLIQGANAKFYAPGGWTPLHRAAARGHSDISALLLKRGAVVDAKSCYGITPLFCAANGDQVGRCLNLLISNGAQVNCRDRGGRTPLHYAAKEGNMAAVKNLLMAGADKNAKDMAHRAPRDVAKNKNVRKILL